MTDQLVLAKQEADAELAVALEWYGLTKDFVITTDEEQEHIAGVVRKTKERIAGIESKRKEFVAPLNKVVKGLNDFFRPPREAFENVERHLKKKIVDYLNAKAAANAAALKAAATASTPEQATAAIATVAPVAPPAGVSVRHVWRFEITDPCAVPREYCSPDLKKIGLVDPTTTQIPGVRFFQEPVVSSRRG